jgi:hypothetical protein
MMQLTRRDSRNASRDVCFALLSTATSLFRVNLLLKKIICHVNKVIVSEVCILCDHTFLIFLLRNYLRIIFLFF